MGITTKGNGRVVFGPRNPPPSPLFKMTIDTTQAGSASDTFVLPLNGGATNMTVHWGDGNSDLITAYNQTELTHIYTVSGSYQISCDGSFGGVYFANLGDRRKVTSIDNWGNNQWVSMQFAFYGCQNMVANYTDSPNTSNVTSMERMFFNCILFNGVIDFDGTSLLTTKLMFINTSVMNSPVTITNTTLLTDCTSMFGQMNVFNQPITLDTTSVVDMTNMFSYCRQFNSAVNFSDTSNVTSMAGMFFTCLVFDQPVNFDTSSVLNMASMFYQCRAFNQVVNFDTSNVGSMFAMFFNCFVFNQDISSFNITNMTSAASMFLGSAFSTTNYNLLLPAWDSYGTSNVPFHAGTAHYSAGAPTTAHDAMVVRGWTITDGGTP